MKTAIVTMYRRPMSDAARAPSTARRLPLASARRSTQDWKKRAPSQPIVAAAYPSAGSCAATQTGSAIASTIRSMLRTRRTPMGAGSDVLKACVDKPEPQQKSQEPAHEREQNRRSDRRSDAVPHSRAQDEADDDHQPSTGGFGSGHGEVDRYSSKERKNPGVVVGGRRRAETPAPGRGNLAAR